VRKETYFREDTRNAYCTLVNAIVRGEIEKVTKDKGVELLNYVDATPPSHPAILGMIGDLLRMRR
jgi:hypothetical protein